jgi:NAD(P)H-hydrate epimerase
MQELDRRTVKECGIPGIVLMENAGRGAAELSARSFRGPGSIAILAGVEQWRDGSVIATSEVGIQVKVYLFRHRRVKVTLHKPPNLAHGRRWLSYF